MFKKLKIPVMLILLPAFLLAATGITMFHHTCSMCEVDEYVTVFEATSCCNNETEVAFQENFSCCGTSGEEACNQQCCSLTAEYLVSEEILFPPVQNISLFPVLVPRDIINDIEPVFTATQPTPITYSYGPLIGHSGKDLLVLIHQLKLDCLIA